jgi:hypothetical protein
MHINFTYYVLSEIPEAIKIAASDPVCPSFVAIALSATLGYFFPALATSEWIKALGDGFVKLIKMVIAPIIFCTEAVAELKILPRQYHI